MENMENGIVVELLFVICWLCKSNDSITVVINGFIPFQLNDQMQFSVVYVR